MRETGRWARGGGAIWADADPGNSALDCDTIPGAHRQDSTGLGGSSLGGLVSLYLGLRYATWFGKLAVMSPSVWWNHKSILGYVNERSPEIWERPRLWLDVATKKASGRCTMWKC